MRRRIADQIATDPLARHDYRQATAALWAAQYAARGVTETDRSRLTDQLEKEDDPQVLASKFVKIGTLTGLLDDPAVETSPNPTNFPESPKTIWQAPTEPNP